MKKITIMRPIRNKRDALTILVLLAIAILPFFVFGSREKNTMCILSFLLNGMVFVMGMHNAKREKDLSLRMIYWIFMFFFMYFAPLIQYLLSKYPWRGAFTDKMILQINFLVLLFNMFFVIGTILMEHIKILGVPRILDSEYLSGIFTFRSSFRKFFTLIIVGLSIYSFLRTGLLGIIVARINAVSVFYSGENTAIELLIDSVLPAFFVFVVAEAAQRFVEKKENCVRFLLLFLCLLICFFPTTLPRYKTATLYGSIFLVLFPKAKKAANFFWLFIFGMFFAFPLLNAFRYIISSESLQAVFEDGFLSIYAEADYDAYRMLGSALKYYLEEGSTLGRQLLGTLLFFVPRSIWPTKPGGSGAMLIRAEKGSTVPSNVSCPFIAEGLVNYGIVGVIIFALILSAFIKILDNNYKKTVAESSNMIFSPYFLIIFMMFFVLRGDLLSGFAYICGFVVVGYMLRLIAKDS